MWQKVDNCIHCTTADSFIVIKNVISLKPWHRQELPGLFDVCYLAMLIGWPSHVTCDIRNDMELNSGTHLETDTTRNRISTLEKHNITGT